MSSCLYLHRWLTTYTNAEAKDLVLFFKFCFHSLIQCYAGLALAGSNWLARAECMLFLVL